ncbi:MAG TPA: sigma-E processing peptidase SpoIIGA, partial [Bacillota bacterium]|nr:sigma-E processing peptidase SpoIIGA [Bacillota bacterium]
ADVLLIINFCVDFVCLYLAGRLCAIPMKAWRLSIAALTGALYVLGSLFFSFWGIHLVVGILLCLIAFGGKLRRLMKVYICFMLFAALLGGIFTAIYNICASSFDYLIALLLAAAVSFIFVRSGKKEVTMKTASLRISDNDIELNLKAFVDNGNLLEDPLSGDAVILVKRSALPEQYDISSKKGYRPIPANGVGSTLLFAFRPENIEVRTFFSRTYTPLRAVVALDESNGTYAGCEALIPGSIL